MGKGKTMPAGASGLGTAAKGSRLQVTYHGTPLFTFYTDNKASTNGEGEGGFVVAQLSSPS